MSASYHVPVLAHEVQAALEPAFRGESSSAQAAIYVDCTTGGGGHAASARSLKPAHMWLFDRDPAALKAAETRFQEPPPSGAHATVHWVHRPFSELRATLEEAQVGGVSAILADLGVSSRQLDDGARGFSFRFDAPLDMRMDPTRGKSAGDLLDELEPRQLERILRDYGEQPHAKRVARAIMQDRPRSTLALAELVARVMGPAARASKTHPATRTFQALRIAVNEELEELEVLLRDAPELLLGGGRLAIISFHSLEDRVVKRAFARLSRPTPLPRGLPIPEDQREQPKFELPRAFRGGVTANESELSSNPRARSARLRVLERRSEAPRSAA